MPLWLNIVLIAHLLYAVVFLADHVVMQQSIKDEYAYTFYISVLSGLALLLFPFGATILSPQNTFIALAAGASFSIASLFFFKSLKQQQASYVAPFVGGLVPIFTLITSFFIGVEIFPQGANIYLPFGLGFLIIGSFTIGWNSPKKRKKLSYNEIETMIISGVFFGISFATIKLLFTNVGFINGLVWSRVGMVLIAILLILFPEVRKAIRKESRRKRNTFQWLILSNKLLGAAASVALLFTVSLANPTVVNSLQGVQYVFLILIVALFGSRFPKVIGESLFGRRLVTTATAIGFIVTGLIFIAL